MSTEFIAISSVPPALTQEHGYEDIEAIVLTTFLSSTPQVIERALRTISDKYNTEPDNPAVGIVRISGTLHSEERAAFLEVAHQLCT